MTYRLTTRRGGSKDVGKTASQKFFGDLLKLIPAEASALYTTGSNLIPLSDDISGFGSVQTVVLLAFTLLCLFVSIFMTVIGTGLVKDPQKKRYIISWKKANKPLVIISSIAFVLWVYATGGIFKYFEGLWIPWLSSLLLVSFLGIMGMREAMIKPFDK